MFEVRVDNNTVEFSSDLRDALIGAIDFISVN
ncbi:Uncharacterised protein [Streptococcus pseudoporcinus]|uniref:Uncharacterized protein n=1 Tax=Streptococcus pseudoporcinus TaxID=361101 RepID=A0A4U9XNX3_9STRE|nr:Uncharacterised protein [Streptococcus pseudoporcinus]